ncbi:MAG TPA: pirin family protein [Methanolinea sp.]|nr:pirin family protein [Methanolinea sp.]HRU80667.1 pirin family protein [Methanolinea sp.]
MSSPKSVAKTFISRETIEGAGVRLHRAFGNNQIPQFDPFLMLDDFRAERTEDYLVGFPWHPHRGIETVTYMLEGRVEHGDSMGHSGNVTAGGVQWMTAGSGIIHQEMPKPVDGRMGGFQLWVNLPRKNKMMDPRYQELGVEEIPRVTPNDGVSIIIISGNAAGISGPVRDIIAEPEFFDISLGPDIEFSQAVRPGYMAAAYIIGGTGTFDRHQNKEVENRTMLLFGDSGTSVDVHAGDGGVRFLYFSGKPLREPIAWGGPIVMNTQDELRQAFAEYRNGTFLRKVA